MLIASAIRAYQAGLLRESREDFLRVLSLDSTDKVARLYIQSIALYSDALRNGRGESHTTAFSYC
jgi:hypothetical protein